MDTYIWNRPKIPSIQQCRKWAVLIKRFVQCVDYCYDIRLHLLVTMWQDLRRSIFLTGVFALSHIPMHTLTHTNIVWEVAVCTPTFDCFLLGGGGRRGANSVESVLARYTAAYDETQFTLLQTVFRCI